MKGKYLKYRNTSSYVIVGDETPTVKCLELDVRHLLPSHRLAAVLPDSISVEEYAGFAEAEFVVADVDLPDGSGIEALRRGAPNVPVLFFGEQDRNRYDFSGLWLIDYLLKPVDRHEMGDSLSRFRQFQHMHLTKTI